MDGKVKRALNIIIHLAMGVVVTYWNYIVWTLITDYGDDEYEIGVMIAVVMIIIGFIIVVPLEIGLFGKMKDRQCSIVEAGLSVFISEQYSCGTVVIRIFFLLLLFSCPVVSDSLQPHGLPHARPPCPSASPRVCPSSSSLHP